jgi:hypothetical protein
MIISNDRLFPYPLLKKDNENFITSKFEINTEYRHNQKEYEFLLKVNLDEKNLLNLIDKGDVSLMCHLECSKTKFRSIQKLKLGDNNFKINVSFLEGRLQLYGFIIAEKDIEKYYSKDFDSEYEGNSFFIEKGSILGVSEIPPIIIENRKENISNLPSIFDIMLDKENEVMRVGLTQDRIKISLPLEQYKIRNANKTNFHSRNIMNSMIVFPALVFVLNELSKANSITEHGNLRWFAVINKKLNKLGYNIMEGDLEDSDIFHIAQELLEDLFSEAMDAVDYLEELE